MWELGNRFLLGTFTYNPVILTWGISDYHHLRIRRQILQVVFAIIHLPEESLSELFIPARFA